MKKIISTALTAIFLLFCFIFSAYASQRHITVPEGYISGETLKHLERKAENIQNSFGYDVCFVMNEEVSKKGAYESAKSFFEAGDIENGCVFAMEKESGKCYIYGNDLTEDEKTALLRSYTAVEGGTYGERIEGFLDKITELARERSEDNDAVSERLKPRFMDIACVIDDNSESAIYTDIDSFSERKKLDVVYVIYDSEEECDAYAEKFYTDNNFGFGRDKDGVILAVNHTTSEISLRLFGGAKNLFGENTSGKFIKLIKDTVAQQDYVTVFIKYLDFLSENYEPSSEEITEEETTLSDDYFPAFEDGSGENGGVMPRVYDPARLLSDTTEKECIAVLDKVSEETGVDFIVLTVYEIPDELTVSEYARRYFEHFDFGGEGEKSGVLLLISVEPESCFISSYGKAKMWFGEGDLRDYTEEIYTLWRKENYDSAVHTFSFEAAQRLMKEKLEIPVAAGVILFFIAAILSIAVIVSKKKKKLETANN